MKLILLSGAGLSAPSGIPTAQSGALKNELADFYSDSENTVREMLVRCQDRFAGSKPNRAHYECENMEQFCKTTGVEFQHYTLNVDSLLEQAGASVEHIYGCIDDVDSILENRDSNINLATSIDWEDGDLLVFLGISNEGYPLAYIEACVAALGVRCLNYNLVQNPDLTCRQIIGDISQLLSSIDVVSQLPLVFNELDLGTYKVDTFKISISTLNYVVYFSPSIEFYTELDLLDDVQKRIEHTLTDRSFEIKFDHEHNLDGGPEAQFKPPMGPPLSLQYLNILGDTICALINIHKYQYDGEFYTATAAHSRLVNFYDRLARRYCNKLNYPLWSKIDLNEEKYYVIKTH